MKPKHRYNNKTGKLDEVFNVDAGTTVIHSGLNPLTGLAYQSTDKLADDLINASNIMDSAAMPNEARIIRFIKDGELVEVPNIND